jgi:ABC-type multidrug transport system ATPase subunit
MNTVLQTNQLTKHFGRIKAVQNLDVQIEKGQVFGILGPNGSGKTTTLGMLLGVTKRTSGTFSWFEQGDGHALRKRIGAILEHPIFYPFLNAIENLKIAAHIKDVRKPDFDGLLKTVGLYDRRHDAFKTYSLGMKQRLAIATALVSDPEILIFDEPTNGLDPQGIADIRKMIVDIADMGKTIILASHLLDEVQKVCSDFMVLKSGVKVFQGGVDEVLNQKQRIEVYADDEEALRRALSEIHQITAVKLEYGVLVAELNADYSARDLNTFLYEKGIVASHLANVRSSLEEQFLSILEADD